MLRLRYRQLDGLQCIGSQDIWRIVRNHFDLRILWQVRWSWEDIRERMYKHGLRWLELVFIQEASSRTVLLQFGNSCTHELYRVKENLDMYNIFNNYSMSMARIWEARSLCSLLFALFYQRKLFKTPIKSSFFSFLWLLCMFTKYWIRLLLSSRIPSISKSAKVTSFESPFTFFTISKKSLMYSSALFFYWERWVKENKLTSDMIYLCYSSLMPMNS